MLLGEAAEQADLGVLVWNADRRYVAANPRACELLGVTREQLLGSPMGTTNRTEEASATIDELVRHVPARGTTRFGDTQLEWVVFATSVAGLDHVVGLFWLAGTL